MPHLPWNPRKRIVAVWETSETYIRWRYDDGSEEGAYNLMYDTDHGTMTLKRIIEEAIRAGKAGNRN